MANYLKALINWAKLLSRGVARYASTPGKSGIEEFQIPEDFKFCHKETVHIFIRGLADGKLHAAKNRNYSDFRFYKKQGLKVFCAVCRKRLV